MVILHTRHLGATAIVCKIKSELFEGGGLGQEDGRQFRSSSFRSSKRHQVALRVKAIDLVQQMSPPRHVACRWGWNYGQQQCQRTLHCVHSGGPICMVSQAAATKEASELAAGQALAEAKT